MVTPDWIPPLPGENLPSYAERFAGEVEPEGPCFVGGLSFGGMVAMEMSQFLEAKGVFLISSVRSPNEFPRRVKAVASLSAWYPVKWFWLVSRILSKGIDCTTGSEARPLSTVFARFAESDPGFLKWAGRAVQTWEDQPRRKEVPVFQIHGKRDWILPASSTQADTLVEDGGHLLPLTHPRNVGDFLEKHMKVWEGAFA